jgi:hypothetical protein
MDKQHRTIKVVEMGIECRFMILSSLNDFLEMRIALCFMAQALLPWSFHPIAG